MARQLGDIIGFVEINGQRHTVKIDQGFRGYLQDSDRESTTSFTNIGSILSGTNTALQQINDRIDDEVEDRIDGDEALAGTGDGTGTSDSRTYSGKTSSGATWVTLATCMVTPAAAAGEYAFVFSGDAPLGHLDNEGAVSTTFNGNWRIIEEENGGGTPVELDTGTFTVQHFPESIAGEGGGAITIPEFWVTIFNDLPAVGIANTYDSIVVDLRFEIQRASGTNEITAPGLSGTFRTDWTP